MSATEAERWAAILRTARRERRPIAPITDQRPLSMTDAYRIQDAVTQARLAGGERRVGWKLGYTSQAMRDQMGVAEPNFGPLTDAMALVDGSSVPLALTQPRVEPEIVVRLGRPLRAPVTAGEVLDACAAAHGALEVVDSMYLDYRFRIEDNTADGSSAAQFVLGPPLALDRLDTVPVRLLHNGRPAGTATGAAAMGHPAVAVSWLVGALHERGEHLRAGDIVLTGGLTAAVALAPGDHVEAVFDTGTVSVRRPG